MVLTEREEKSAMVCSKDGESDGVWLGVSWVCSFLYIQLTWNPFPDDCDRWTKMTTRQEVRVVDGIR